MVVANLGRLASSIILVALSAQATLAQSAADSLQMHGATPLRSKNMHLVSSNEWLQFRIRLPPVSLRIRCIAFHLHKA